MLPRPPTSTLFPYTTLFRSSVQETARMTALLNPADFSLDNYVRLFGENRFARALLKRFSRSEEHTSELQSRGHLVCRLLLEKKKKKKHKSTREQKQQSIIPK